MWLDSFKLALILEETTTLSTLLDQMPRFENLAEMEEAAFLLQQAYELTERNKHETAHTLKQLKNTLEFLKSTQNLTDSSLNIKL
jgi:hypothetical protein